MAIPSLDEVPRLQMASDGAHDVRIINAKEFTSKKGNECLKVTFQVEDEDMVEPFSTFMNYPTTSDERNNARFAARLASFINCFDLPSEAEPDDMLEASGRLVTKTKETYKGDGYENDVAYFM